MNAPASDAAHRNEARRAISRGIVALLKEAVGRGPTSSRTFFNEELVLVVLDDTLTTAEKTLADEGRSELVREMRRAFSVSMTERMKALVTEESGRNVRAVFSDHSVSPDCAFVAFILEPNTGEHPAVGAPGAGAGVEGDADHASLSVAPRVGVAAATKVDQREIARGIVALTKDLVGRGPSEARAYREEDVVIVLLGDTLTQAEQAMNDASGSGSAKIQRVRRVVHDLMSERASALVAEITGREVTAFLSDNSIFPDYAIKVFLLDDEAPAADAEPAAAR